MALAPGGSSCGYSWSSSMLDIGAKADTLGTCLGRVGPHRSVHCLSNTCVSACVQLCIILGLGVYVTESHDGG